MNRHNICLTLIISRHLARVEGRNQSVAITRTARKLRDETKDKDVYQLLKFYAGELPTNTVNGKRMTGEEIKIMSVGNLERDMRFYGVLASKTL
jgi:hypothetical protein